MDDRYRGDDPRRSVRLASSANNGATRDRAPLPLGVNERTRGVGSRPMNGNGVRPSKGAAPHPEFRPPARAAASAPVYRGPARRARRAPTPHSHKALGTRAPCAETPMDAIPASDEHIPTHRRAQRAGPLPESARITNHLAAPVSAEPSTEATPTRPHVTAQAKAGVRARDT